tara:strand:- start:849 stop:1373 length:525 start_codon:yes stop_codon:yes gene_type:complete
MFSELWILALNNYYKDELKKIEIKFLRLIFKFKYKVMINRYYDKYKSIKKNKDLLLSKIVLINQTNLKFLTEYNKYYDLKYKILNFNPNFFSYTKITHKVYRVNLIWKYSYYFNPENKNNDLFFSFKFYCKHDYPYNIVNNICKNLLDQGYYINSYNKEYLLNKLIKLWTGYYF